MLLDLMDFSIDCPKCGKTSFSIGDTRSSQGFHATRVKALSFIKFQFKILHKPIA